ncbi:hypothetical protein G6045_33420 [Streptomyces sp. YC504]|uniref:Uncharacterized protein n=1 Tax=Streptomyces mesophilus TaxID=1775132 RepID=A0A6G4XV83_9ACTN|nr:hypothetical protein [Streptomyces mesophilus]NGO80521.1 hypothetical protein [Streptomyces mesophilus]
MTELTDAERDNLRQALALIGEEAHRDVRMVPDTPSSSGSRARRRILVPLVAAAALTVGISLAVGLSGNEGAPEDATGQGQSRFEAIACASQIAIGDVTAVDRQSVNGRVRVTFKVQEWIKPAQSGPKAVTWDLVDPTQAKVREPWAVGQHVLVSVPVRTDLPADTWSGASLDEQRTAIVRDLPRADRTQCPPYWSTPRGAD